MSERERKILLGSGVLPLILGGNPLSAFLFSVRLFVKYGLSSVFCGKGSLGVSILNPRCGYLPRTDGANTRLSVERLLDFADGNSELTLIIIPMSGEAKALVSAAKSELESRYIVLDGRKSLFSHPLFCNEEG